MSAQGPPLGGDLTRPCVWISSSGSLRRVRETIRGPRWINPGSRMDRGAMISTNRRCGYANKCSDRVGWGFGSSAFTLASLVPERMINDQKSLVLYKQMHAPTRFVHFE